VIDARGEPRSFLRNAGWGGGPAIGDCAGRAPGNGGLGGATVLWGFAPLCSEFSWVLLEKCYFFGLVEGSEA